MSILPAGQNGTLDLEQVALRLGLIGSALLTFWASYEFWLLGRVPEMPVSYALAISSWFTAIAMLILAAGHRVPGWAAWLAVIGPVAYFLSHTYFNILHFSPLVFQRTDNSMITQFAAEALRRGQNPYAWNFTDMLRVFRENGLYSTPFLNGTMQNRVTHPPLGFLLSTAFGVIGMEDPRYAAGLAYLSVIVMTTAGSPKSIRPLVPMTFALLGHYYAGFLLAGGADAIWCALLVGMLLTWKNPTLRAVLFGLAATHRQQPWFIAPFLLTVLWYEGGTTRERFERMARFAVISVGVFFLINLPFIIWDPVNWAQGVFEPLYAQFNVFSQGLGLLSEWGIVPLPRVWYSLVQFSVWGLAILVHFRHPREVGQAYWIVPAIMFFVYYRGIANYWLYWLPPLILAISIGFGSPKTLPFRPIGAGRWRVSALIAAALLTFIVGSGVAFVLTKPRVAMRLLPPLQTSYDYEVAGMWLEVTNTTDEVIEPRFAVQHSPDRQPMPWLIDFGPLALEPGQRGLYYINSPMAHWRYPAIEGGQVVLSDVQHPYRVQEVLTIPPEDSLRYPDLIENPYFWYWEDPAVPTGWGYDGTGKLNAVQYDTIHGVDAVGIAASAFSPEDLAAAACLTQMIPLPTIFSIDVLPGDEVGTMYGIELDDGIHNLRIIYGSREEIVRETPDRALVYREAPIGEWSRQTVDIAAIYNQLGWALPPYTERVQDGVRYLARQADLRLFVSTAYKGEAQGWFGPIRQLNTPADMTAYLVEDVFEHPADYFRARGDEYFHQRNYALALDAYQTALVNAPGDAGLIAQIERTRSALAMLPTSP